MHPDPFDRCPTCGSPLARSEFRSGSGSGTGSVAIEGTVEITIPGTADDLELGVDPLASPVPDPFLQDGGDDPNPPAPTAAEVVSAGDSRGPLGPWSVLSPDPAPAFPWTASSDMITSMNLPPAIPRRRVWPIALLWVYTIAATLLLLWLWLRPAEWRPPA